MFDFKNNKVKDVLITGAYGGMGRATAELMAKQGYRVFALDRKVGEARENITPIEVDVSSEESVSAAAEKIGRAHV